MSTKKTTSRPAKAVAKTAAKAPPKKAVTKASGPSQSTPPKKTAAKKPAAKANTAKPAPSKTKSAVQVTSKPTAKPKAAAKTPPKPQPKAPTSKKSTASKSPKTTSSPKKTAETSSTPAKKASTKAKPNSTAKKATTPATKSQSPKPPAAAKKTSAKPTKPTSKKATPAPETAPPLPAPKANPTAQAVKKAPKPGKKTVAKGLEIAPPPPKREPPQTTESDGPNANGALYYDSHMHTPLCKHAWGEPEEYAQQAITAGLKGIIFTCHCPMPGGFWPTVRMSDDEFPIYLDLVQRTADSYRGRVDVRLGLESEFFPGMEPWIEALHQRVEFDYILGGLHWQSREYLAQFEPATIEGFRKVYFNHLAQSAETGLYDCLAHPDLVKNYHPDSWCLTIVRDHIARALDRIATTGIAMEINTSGLNKSYPEMNPGLDMLRMMADRQIPIVIGSDAHRPNRVGEHFMTALGHLQEVGYERVSYFIKRKRIDLQIAEVRASIKRAADSQIP